MRVPHASRAPHAPHAPHSPRAPLRFLFQAPQKVLQALFGMCDIV